MANRQGLALTGCRVLDLTDAQGVFGTRLLADLGADVIKIEPPGGDLLRQRGPFYHNAPHPERSLSWFLFNANKRGIVLDLGNAADRTFFTTLVENADIVVECFPPGYLAGYGLDYEGLRRINPAIILTSITPFGQSGPYKDYRGSDIVGQAMGGLMFLHGDPDRAPLRITSSVAYLLAGLQAAVGSLIAYHYKQSTGTGQHVDLSVQAAVAFASPYHFIYWDADKSVPRRMGSKAQVHRKAFETLFQTTDGAVAGWLGILGDKPGQKLMEWMASDGMAGDLTAKSTEDQPLLMRTQDMSQEEIEHREELVKKFVARYSTAEFSHKAQELGIEITPLYSIKDVICSEQLKLRGYFLKVPHPELDVDLLYPNSPFHKMSETPGGIWRRAPLLNEHKAEIRRQIMPSRVANNSPAPMRISSRNQALAGVKVLDFTWQGVGPLTTRQMAHHGAEVIRVESSKRLDLQRANGPMKGGIESPERSGMFSMWNSNKYGMTLNLKHPKGMEIARRLVEWADIVADSYTGGTMERMGLGYEELRKINPSIIMIEMALAGQTGPWKHFRGHGQQLGATTGIGSLLGWTDRPPLGQPWAFTDWFVPHFADIAILSALEYRRRTGKGQYIDLAQLEAAVYTLEAAILDCTVNGRVLKATGNRLPYEMSAPHGAYRCLGDDQWCVISVFSDDEWQALRKIVGNPFWSHDTRFATTAGRIENADELDKHIEEWTRNYTPKQVMTLMQAAGIPAGAVLGGQELFEDPQLAHRHQIWQLDHPEMGKTAYFGPTFILSETPAEVNRPAPCLGEHNAYVCSNILGMSDEEFASLLNDGVFE